jgi:hypothetical protein
MTEFHADSDVIGHSFTNTRHAITKSTPSSLPDRVTIQIVQPPIDPNGVKSQEVLQRT